MQNRKLSKNEETYKLPKKRVRRKFLVKNHVTFTYDSRIYLSVMPKSIQSEIIKYTNTFCSKVSRISKKGFNISGRRRNKNYSIQVY